MNHKFDLNQKVKSNVSVEMGRVIAVSFSLYRQTMYQIQYTDKEGYNKEEWFYESDLDAVV